MIKLIVALAIYIASCWKFNFVSIYTQKNPYNNYFSTFLNSLSTISTLYMIPDGIAAATRFELMHILIYNQLATDMTIDIDICTHV